MPKLSRGELTNLAIGLPIATAIIGALAGIGLGFAIGWILKPGGGPSDEQVERLTLEAFSAAQIDFKCGQIKGEELKNANERIAALEQERTLYEQKVIELEQQLETKKVAKSTGGGTQGGGSVSRQREAELNARAEELERQAASLRNELEMARNQLATVTRQLSEAQEEKRVLQEALVKTSTELAVTKQELVVQVDKTKAAESDAMQQKWWRFLGEAQLSVCEKGNRKKLGRCREKVQELLNDRQTRGKVLHCIRSKQATPTVRELAKNTNLPRYAMFLDEDDKITRDWYIQLCDPTLPEASGFGAAPPMTPATTTSGRDLDLDLQGLEDLDVP